MASISSDRGLTIPLNGGDNGVWGTELNTTLGAIDTILGGSITYLSSQGNWIPTSSQAQMGRWVIAGTPSSAGFTIYGYSSNYVNGLYTVWNQTSAAITLVGGTFSSGATTTLPANTMRIIDFDGVNAQFNDQIPTFTLANPGATINFNISGGGLTPPAGWYGAIEIPFTFTTASYQVFCDQAGTATVTIYHSAGYSLWHGSSEAAVGVSGTIKNTGTYGPVVYAPGDIMGFYLTGATTVTMIGVNIIGTRSLSS